MVLFSYFSTPPSSLVVPCCVSGSRPVCHIVTELPAAETNQRQTHRCNLRKVYRPTVCLPERTHCVKDRWAFVEPRSQTTTLTLTFTVLLRNSSITLRNEAPWGRQPVSRRCEAAAWNPNSGRKKQLTHPVTSPSVELTDVQQTTHWCNSATYRCGVCLLWSQHPI